MKHLKQITLAFFVIILATLLGKVQTPSTIVGAFAESYGKCTLR